MRIGYGKFARSWNLGVGEASTVGGDIDVARLLMRMALRRSQDEIFLVGRCQGGDPRQYGYPANVVSPWHSLGWSLPAVSADDVERDPGKYYLARDKFRELTHNLHLDALVLWIGQVANSNSPIPPSGEDWGPQTKLTSPQVMSVNYTLYLVDLCNRTGIEPILLCPDPRNYWKPRELTRPLTRAVLAQYVQNRGTRHEQYEQWGMPWQEGHARGGSQILAPVRYDYAGVELAALDDPENIEFHDSHEREHAFGLVTNENANAVPEDTSRLHQIRKYVLARWPYAPIHGTWTETSTKAMGRIDIAPIPYTSVYDKLRSFRATMTFPASGSGWATAKPWEAFAVGTPIFFHPRYDDQGWIIPRMGPEWRELRDFLLVYNQRQLWERVARLEIDGELFRSIVTQQRARLMQAYKNWDGGLRRVTERLGETQRPWG